MAGSFPVQEEDEVTAFLASGFILGGCFFLFPAGSGGGGSGVAFFFAFDPLGLGGVLFFSFILPSVSPDSQLALIKRLDQINTQLEKYIRVRGNICEDDGQVEG